MIEPSALQEAIFPVHRGKQPLNTADEDDVSSAQEALASALAQLVVTRMAAYCFLHSATVVACLHSVTMRSHSFCESIGSRPLELPDDDEEDEAEVPPELEVDVPVPGYGSQAVSSTAMRDS